MVSRQDDWKAFVNEGCSLGSGEGALDGLLKGIVNRLLRRCTQWLHRKLMTRL